MQWYRRRVLLLLLLTVGLPALVLTSRGVLEAIDDGCATGVAANRNFAPGTIRRGWMLDPNRRQQELWAAA